MTIYNINNIEGTEFPAGRRTRVIVGPGAPVEADGFVMGYVTLYPGGSVPEHEHSQEEVYTILSGSGILLMGEETYPVQAGSYAYIPSGQKHRLTNTGAGEMAMMFCYAPKSVVDHWRQELYATKSQP